MSGFNNLSDWFTEIMSPTMMQQGENMYTANARQNAEITNKYFNPMSTWMDGIMAPTVMQEGENMYNAANRQIADAIFKKPPTSNTYSASPALGDWAKSMFDNPNIGKYGQPLNGGVGGMGGYTPFAASNDMSQYNISPPAPYDPNAPLKLMGDINWSNWGGMPTIPPQMKPTASGGTFTVGTPSTGTTVPTTQVGNPLISNPNYMDAAMGSALNQQLAGNSNIAGLDTQMQSHFDGIDAAGGLKNQNFLQGFGGGMFDGYTNKDLIGGGLSMFQAGMGLYNDFRNFGLEEDKVDIQRGALNLSREKYADSVADKELRIAQNKRTNR